MKQISLNRISLLIKRYVFMNLKTHLIYLAGAAAILLMLSLLTTWVAKGEYDYLLFQNQMKAIAIFGGFIITSKVFKEISSKHRGWFYMMLPANPIEKVLAYWLTTSIGYIVIASIAMVVLSIITSLITSIFFKTALYVYNPVDKTGLMFMVHYCILQSVFFLGAISFRKNNFLKTILAMFVVIVVVAIILGIISYLLYNDASIDSTGMNIINPKIYYSLNIVYYALVIPFFLTVSYFKFKERR
ncbi:MAG: hypothetical protein ACOX0M_09520 [Salinivirgaceae bacterium]|jgi:hypothetical protein|nr:hypothetical protein [Bacteroidales bacterium]